MAGWGFFGMTSQNSFETSYKSNRISVGNPAHHIQLTTI